MSELRLYDQTRLGSFKACARLYYYRHVRDFVPEAKALPLIFGSGWGAALDVVWQRHAELADNKQAVIDAAYEAFIAKWTENGQPHPDQMTPDEVDEWTPRIPQVALEMLHEYIPARQHIFSDPSFKLLDVEHPFAVPLDPNDASLFYVGRFDKLIEFRGKATVIEHKTSSMYKVGGPFQSAFVDSFSPNSQITGYEYALRMEYGARTGGVFVDAALVHKKTHDGFLIIPIESSDAQIDAWMFDVLSWIDQVEANKAALTDPARLNGSYMAAFPKNTSSCISFNRACPMMPLCNTIDNPAKIVDVPQGYKAEHWDPFSHLQLDKLKELQQP